LDNAKFAEQVKNDNLDAAFKTATQKLDAAKYGTSVAEWNATNKLAVAKYNTTTALNAAKYKTTTALNAAKYSTSVDQFNVKTTLDYKKLNLAAQKAAQSAYQSDRSYQISLAGLGIRQKNAQIAALAAEAKKQLGGFTLAKITDFKGQAYTIATDGINGYDVGPVGKSKHVPGFSYNEAVKQVRRAGIPLSVALPIVDKAYGNPNGPSLSFAGLVGRSALTAIDRATGVAPIVTAAASMLGTPYVWGGTTPGKSLDCSGFVQKALASVGINISRTTYTQVKQGVGVSLNQLQPGDAIFTIPSPQGPKHVGLYIGNGQVQVSPTTGDVNKIVSLQSYLSLGFVAARRYSK
jgi:cell wall-associated NlpC family hydrolase